MEAAVCLLTGTIDVAAATRRRIVVTNTPGVLTGTTADFTWTSPGYAEAGRHARPPMLWLYAEGDSYYSPNAIRGYFASFEKAGGNGRLVLFGGVPGNGHRLLEFVSVWKADAERFLESLGF